MTSYEPLLPTGEATLRCYEGTFDPLTLELPLWDETTKVITAFGVTTLIDVGAWEVNAIVRIPELDGGGVSGVGAQPRWIEGVLSMEAAVAAPPPLRRLERHMNMEQTYDVDDDLRVWLDPRGASRSRP
jgi:hypothetical protein